MAVIEIPYRPRKQFLPYHNRKERFAITVAHRRAGKTVAEVNDGGKRALSIKRSFPPPQVAFISPTYKQSKRNAWPYARHYFQNIPGIQFSESELTVTFPNKARLMFAGSDNPDSLRGMYLDHASLDEYGDQDPRVWGEVVRPALSDYGGGATFIGSARGRNHFYELLRRHEKDDDFLITILKASQTGIIPREELELARRTMTAEEYDQEYECSFDAAIRGAYYGKEIAQADDEGRVARVPYDKAATETFAAWDLGIGDSTAIWIGQTIPGGEWHWIDHYESSGQNLEHYVNWIKDLPYRVDRHILPHDGDARELQTGNSRREFLEARGLDCHVLPRHSPDDRISATRLKFNRFWFDGEKCKHGLDCLRMYRADYDERHQTLKPRPLHDWASHSADAFGYGVMGAREHHFEVPAEDYETEWVV